MPMFSSLVWWVSLVKRIFQEELGPAYQAPGHLAPVYTRTSEVPCRILSSKILRFVLYISRFMLKELFSLWYRYL